jgi:hypothetical protein
MNELDAHNKTMEEPIPEISLAECLTYTRRLEEEKVKCKLDTMVAAFEGANKLAENH